MFTGFLIVAAIVALLIYQGVDLTITAANVKPVAGSTQVMNTSLAAVTITQGQSVYLNASSPPAWALGQGTTAVLSGGGSTVGVALSSALAGQPLTVWVGGDVTIGATVVVGELYVISGAVAGNICPVADNTAGKFDTYLGWAPTATTLRWIGLIQNVAHG